VTVDLFALTDEQREIQAVCREFAGREIRPVSLAVDEADVETPWEIFHRAAELGLTSFMLPERFGGGGMTDVFTQTVVQEELCFGCSGIGNLITSNGFFAKPVLELGTEEQAERWVAPLCVEKPPLTALASTEPGVGSDAAAMTTTARRVDGGYVLQGQKSWISSAGPAEYYVVFATVAPGTRSKGITAFVLEKGDPGFTIGPPMRKMGQRALVNAELFFEECFVPEDRRLGDEGQGFRGLMHTFDQSRITLGAAATGLARAALEYAVEYAKTREQFGRPIAEHQAVAFRLADMATQIEAAHQMVLNAARLKDAKSPCLKEASMAKLFASEMAEKVCSAAIQIHGGYGYLEGKVERIYRDVRVCQIYEGTSDVQRIVISRALAGEA
jgi:acyl-CoA dehydrogenase